MHCYFVFLLLYVTRIVSFATEYFYIYDYDYWVNISLASTNLRNDPNEILETTINNGAGPLVDAKHGAYHTDQYQLFLLLFNRALRDHRRTLDPAKATTFFIPYDMASDVAYYKRCAKSEETCFDFRRCPLAPSVEKLLQESPWYRRNYGKDHLLIVGNNYAMEHYLKKPKCRAILSGTCYNCTKMSIDDYSFLHSADQGTVDKGEYWHAIPFPADFHWTRQVVTPFPWENTERPILVSYVGSSRSYYGPARRLRGSIVHYCELHTDLCVHQTYGRNGTRSSFKVDGYDPLQVSRQSVFCFQPIGDLMTRKGLFDSMLHGCIPVTFDPLTATAMYTWHWEEEYWKDVVVDLPFHPVAYRYSDPVLALQELLRSDPTLVRRKQELLRARVFELQYALEGPLEGEELVPGFQVNSPLNPPTSAVSMGNHSWPVDSAGKWFRDAFDICIDHALGWHSGRVPDYRNATTPECWNGWLDKSANFGKGKCRPGNPPAGGIVTTPT